MLHPGGPQAVDRPADAGSPPARVPAHPSQAVWSQWLVNVQGGSTCRLSPLCLGAELRARVSLGHARKWGSLRAGHQDTSAFVGQVFNFSRPRVPFGLWLMTWPGVWGAWGRTPWGGAPAHCHLALPCRLLCSCDFITNATNLTGRVGVQLCGIRPGWEFHVLTGCLEPPAFLATQPL